MRHTFLHRALLFFVAPALGLTLTRVTVEAAQAQTGTIRVEVVAAGVPLAGVAVSAGDQSGTTDSAGVAILTLAPGSFSVVATKAGYEPATARADVVAGAERSVRLVMATKGIVSSTRTGRPLDDQAVPVTVLARDRIEENTLRTPGDIVRSLSEIGALHLQTTSPELGLTAIRIHGLPAQYTRLLSDGVPLYFDIPGGLAPVQISPMDLDRVEVITEGASALFGANALAGVVNLLARRPATGRERELLFSQSTRDATDGMLWLASPSSGTWSRTTLIGAHRQDERDVNGDGWSDIAGYTRGVVRQRLFWNNGRGKSAAGTAGVTFEKRKGGSSFAHQELETKIADGALSGQMPLGRFVLAGAGSLYVQSRIRDFSDAREHERRESATIEFQLRGSAPRQTWVTGIAADWFTIRTPEPLVSAYVAPRGGLFVHDDVHVARWLTVSGTGRVDYIKGAGEVRRTDEFFVSSRGSARVHGGPWSARVSAGRSYFVPTVLTEETEAAGVTRLSIDGPFEIETARSVSADLTHKTRVSEVTVSVFGTKIHHPAQIDRATYTLRTDAAPITTDGVEVLGTLRRTPFSVTGTYTYVRARQVHSGDLALTPRDLALTPRHSAGVVAALHTGRSRLSLNFSSTGAQRLERNPYRSRGEPYVLVGLLGEQRFGRYRLFIDGENLTDVRQTDWDPIARPARDIDGRWTVDAWAPLKGRVINAGIRIGF